MALKLNKSISDHMAKMLSKHLDHTVTCEAELVGATITSANVIAELHMPYSLFQEIMEDGVEVDSTFSFGLICATMWANALDAEDLLLPDDEVNFTELVQMHFVLELEKVDKRKVAQKYLSKMLDALWNMVSGTDREQFMIKTLAASKLPDLLDTLHPDSWDKHDVPALLTIGKTMYHHINGKLNPKYALGWQVDWAGGDEFSLPKSSGKPSALSGSPVILTNMHEAASQMMKQKPVKLADAKAIYQPVSASSEGSVYHTVALYEGLAVAVRLQQGGGISIRAEGSGLSKAKSNLEALGMSVKTKYASMHLHAGETLLQAKTIGSFLTGIGLPMLTPPALVSTLIGKGS